MGAESVIAIGGFEGGTDYARFRDKARAFLRAHRDHIAILKLRTNVALTTTDLSELERILIESGIGTLDDVARAREESHGLGLFVRSLVGLDVRRSGERQSALTVGGRPRFTETTTEGRSHG